MTYDISPIVLQLKRIRQAPGVARLMVVFRLSKPVWGYLLMLFAAFWCLIVIAMIAGGPRSETTLDCKIGLVIGSFAILLFRAGLGIVGLTRALKRMEMHDASLWINAAFAKKNRVPSRLPKKGGQRAWTICLMAIRICLLVMVTFLVVAFVVTPAGVTEGLPLVIVAVALYTLSRFIKEKINRLCSYATDEILQSDKRSPVLFLRSFYDDALK
jgi:hypothetical protein